MTLTLKQINKFVQGFLSSQTQADPQLTNLQESWLDRSNQKRLKTMLNRSSSTKDENAPKAAKSAYRYFCDEHRESAKEKLGKGTKATDVTKELGKQWQKLKKNKKGMAKYDALAATDRERYQTERCTYLASQPKGPTRAKSAYLIFCNDNRASVKDKLGEDAKATQVIKELGKQWRLLKEQKKTKKYDELAQVDRDRYLNEKKNLEQAGLTADNTVTEETKTTETAKTTKSSRVKKTTTVASKGEKNAKPSGSDAFKTFCTLKRDHYSSKYPKLTQEELTKKLASAWKRLGADDKKKFQSEPSI
jgi:hypothetical protein